METAAPTCSDRDFWEALDRLVAESTVVIDRPKGSHHPRYPEIIYPVDYGFLDRTTTVDGGGLDVWLGALADKKLSTLVVTVDLHKRDVEIKLLLGCTQTDQQIILDFHNHGMMRATIVAR